MLKKGQVTIFIIIAILIIGIVVIFFVFRGTLNLGGVPSSIDPFYTSFMSCFEETSNDGIYFIAAHGGYYDVPFNTSVIYFTDDIPYYYLDSKNYVPSLNLIEEELGNYISRNLGDCIYLEIYKDQGLDINIKNYSISTKIEEGNVNVKLLNSITISKGEDTAILEDIEVIIKKDLTNLYHASIKIVDSYSQKPGYICLSCLDDLSNEYNVNIEATPVTDVSVFENDIIWYFITNKYDDSYDKLKWVFVVEQ